MRKTILTLILCLSFSQVAFPGNKGIFVKGYQWEIEVKEKPAEIDFIADEGLSNITFFDFEDEPQTEVFLSPESGLVWTINDKEILRVTPAGDFYVEGRLATNDKEIYQKFKKWLDYTMELIEDHP